MGTFFGKKSVSVGAFLGSKYRYIFGHTYIFQEALKSKAQFQVVVNYQSPICTEVTNWVVLPFFLLIKQNYTWKDPYIVKGPAVYQNKKKFIIYSSQPILKALVHIEHIRSNKATKVLWY